MAEEVLNPLTGLPVGGSADITEIDPKTDVKVPMNPLTGQAVGSIQTPQRSYIGGSRRQAASLSDQMLNSQHSVKLGEDIRNFTKYGVPLGQDLDWQEIRARNQSTAEQWGNGLAKAGVTALGAVAENTLGVVFGLGELATGGSYYDNAIGKSVDKTNEWMRENMPNYLTQEEQKMSTLSKLGTANFWADTVANGLGYSLGSIATMWMTGGGGLLTKGITGAAKGLGIYNASKAVINGTKLAAKLGKGANFGTRLMRASQMLEAGAMMSLAEASVEARETQKSVYDDLVQAHINENNLSSISEIDAATLQEFEDTSYAAGNTNFTAQLPVLMGTNLLMFGKQVAGFKGASKASSDVAFDQVKRKAVSKLADKSVWRQALDRMRPTAMNALEEAGQEGFQFASGVFAHSYHTDKFADGGYGDMAKSLNKALSETFGTQEGLESMFVGALTGGLMGSAQSTMGKEYSTRKSSAAALAKFINGGYLNNTEQKILNATASATVMQQMQKHLENGDIKKFKDAQFKLIQYQAYEALQRGGMDVYLEKLEDAKNLDNAQFMEAFGYQTQDAAGNALTLEDQTGGKSQAEVIDSIKKKVENFRKVYDNVNTQFPLADKTSGLPRMLMSEENRKAEDATYKDQENLRAQLIFSGAEIGNRSNRMTDIQKNMGDTISNSISPKKAKLKADLDALLADQDPNSVGEIDPAKDFDAGDQYQKIEDGLQEIRDELIKEDGDVNASNKFFKDAIDYVTLAQENKRALDSYNKLSSDEYFQEQFKREVEAAQKAAKQAQADKKGREVLESAKSAQELGENMPEGISSEIRQEYDKKYKEFKDAENEAIKKFLENDLDTLYNMDKEKMSPIEIQALKDAIDILEKDRENALAPKVKFGFESESTASITEDGVSITPNAEYQQKQQELEEAFRPENLGDVQAMDVNGRVFQIDGNLHYNVQPDPLDAIIRDKNGNIVGIKLRDESGNFVTYSGPETRVDAIAYGILMAEQLKSEGYQELSKDEIFEKLTAFNEEVAQELSTKGDRGKHGSKTTELLREEVYSLERARDEALETYDQLRTYYMQELDATKTELENDKELKDLNRKINSIRAQIGARNRILKLRGETTTPTDSEILKVERKAMKKIENFEQDLASAQNEIQEAQQEIESLQEDVDRFKAADDLDSYRAALADRRAAEALLAEAEKNVKNLKRKINYHKNKLKRLANEKSKQPAGDAEQVAPGTAEKAQEQVDEREDTDSGAVPKETQTNVKPVRYKIKDKTATYTVKYENNEYVVYNSEGNPVNWKEGQQKHKNRIVGKHLVQEGKAVVVEHNGKKFIVTPKYLSLSNTPFIIQEDGKTISRAGLATQQLADIFDAIMRKAAAKFRAMVADTTEAPTDEATEKNAIEEKSKQNLKKEVDNKQTQPGTPKSDKLTVVAEYEMSDLIDDDTAPSGPVGNIADLAPPGAQPNRGEPSARDEEELSKPAAPTMSGSGTQLTAVAAREDKVEVVDELNYKGDVQIKSRVTVSDTGAPDTFDADTLNEEPILVSKEKLAGRNWTVGKDVTFEIIENDYYKSNPNTAVPIYYKIDGDIVGKLEANTPNRDVLERRLRNGEQVTMQVSEVIAGNFNHSRTADGNSFFSDPREVFGNPILAFVEVVDKIPNWTIGNASSDKNITTQIQSDIVGTGTEKINYGQVGIIVRPENNPGGQARISMASTADLSAKAQNVAYEALVNEDFDTAKEIVANSLFEANLGGAAQTQYMQFGTFKQGSNFVVFQSPALGKFVRITEENLRDAHKGKPFKYNIVEVSADAATGTLFFKNTGEVVEGYEAAEDMKEFLKLKKYHVSRDLGNLSNPYTSKITGDTYDTYQEYLFSPKEIGTDRTIGKGHHSILTTDIVMMNGSMFHNPKITFKESAGKIKSAKDIIQSDKTAPGSVDNLSQEQKANLLDELSDMGGLNFGDQIKKDELDQDCPF